MFIAGQPQGWASQTIHCHSPIQTTAAALTQITAAPPYTSLRLPHTNHCRCPMQITTAPPYTSLRLPHTHHCGSPIRITAAPPYSSLPPTEGSHSSPCAAPYKSLPASHTNHHHLPDKSPPPRTQITTSSHTNHCQPPIQITAKGISSIITSMYDSDRHGRRH